MTAAIRPKVPEGIEIQGGAIFTLAGYDKSRFDFRIENCVGRGQDRVIKKPKLAKHL